MVHVGTCFNIAFLWVIDGGCSCISSSKNKDEPIESDCRSIFVICQWKATLRSVLGSGLETGFLFIHSPYLQISHVSLNLQGWRKKNEETFLVLFSSLHVLKGTFKVRQSFIPQYTPPSKLVKYNCPLLKPSGVTVKAPLLHMKLRCQVVSEFWIAASFNTDASHACAAGKFRRNSQRRDPLSNIQ